MYVTQTSLVLEIEVVSYLCSHYLENLKSVLLSEHNILCDNNATESMYLSMRELVEDAALLLV
jgi:hypothetical protein